MPKKITYNIHNYDVHNQTRSCIDYFDDNQKHNLEKDGYLKLAYKLNINEVEKITLATDTLLKAKYSGNQTQTYKSKKFAGQYLRQPHLQNLLFMDLLTDQYPFVDMVRSIMGPRIVVRSFSVRITLPHSNDGTMWHSDQRSFVTPKPLFFTEPHVFTISIYLDSANEDTGPLYIMPGTHRLDKQPSEKEYFQDMKDQTSLIMEHGEVALFHSALWHRGGENKSSKKRRLIVIHFAPIFCKTSNFEDIILDNECKDYIEQLRQQQDEAFLELLGMPGLRYRLFM